MKFITSSIGIFTLLFTISFVLDGCGSGNSGGGGNHPPPPQLTLQGIVSTQPIFQGNNWVVAGTPTFQVLFQGTGFTSTCVLEWNGTKLTTQPGNTTNMTATVPASLVAQPGDVSLTVVDTSTGATSNAVPYYIASAATANTGVVQMVTVAPDGTAANGGSLVAPSISSTGRYVAFQSNARNLGEGVQLLLSNLRARYLHRRRWQLYANYDWCSL